MQRLLAAQPGGPGVIQRKVIIKSIHKKDPIDDEQADAIWNAVVRFDLVDNGISPHRLKGSYYRKLIEGTTNRPETFSTPQAFSTWFVESMRLRRAAEDAEAEKEKMQGWSRGQGSRRTVGKFGLHRPAWPKGYRTWFNAQPGDDLRHVVRNATILRALLEEYEILEATMGAKQLIGYYQVMAGKLGVEAKAGDEDAVIHPKEILGAIYHKLYRNPVNLFGGPGGVNEAIGFSADKIIGYGIELAHAGSEPVEIEAVIKRLMDIVQAYVDQMVQKAAKKREKGDVVGAKRFERGLQAHGAHLAAYLQDLRQVWIVEHGEPDAKDPSKVFAESWALASDVQTMGRNQGWDFILSDEPEVAERQSQLLETEIKLQSRDWKAGEHELTKIFQDFLVDPLQRAGLSMSSVDLQNALRKAGIEQANESVRMKMAANLEGLVGGLLMSAGAFANAGGTIQEEHLQKAFQDPKMKNFLLGSDNKKLVKDLTPARPPKKAKERKERKQSEGRQRPPEEREQQVGDQRASKKRKAPQAGPEEDGSEDRSPKRLRTEAEEEDPERLNWVPASWGKSVDS